MFVFFLTKTNIQTISNIFEQQQIYISFIDANPKEMPFIGQQSIRIEFKEAGFIKDDGHRSCRCHFHVGPRPISITLPTSFALKTYKKSWKWTKLAKFITRQKQIIRLRRDEFIRVLLLDFLIKAKTCRRFSAEHF